MKSFTMAAAAVVVEYLTEEVLEHCSQIRSRLVYCYYN